MILPIGDWVLREACAQASRWREARPERSMQMSVNLSVHQFHEHNLIGHVARVLADTGFDARDLALEITESVLMEDSASTIARLRDPRNMGVQVAIDDFGTGYSSLSYLKRFPVDLLKLDRSFIQALGQGPRESAFARAIIELSRTLRLRSVAEGVETAQQAEELRRLGCDLAQGYYFHRPMVAEALEAMIDKVTVISPGRQRRRSSSSDKASVAAG